MCKHIVYTTIVNFQMNIVHRRKIKNRKKKKKTGSQAEHDHLKSFGSSLRAKTSPKSSPNSCREETEDMLSSFFVKTYP